MQFTRWRFFGPVDDNIQESITLNFSKVALKFDWSKKLNTAFVSGDYGEMITAHNVANPDWNKYSGTIDNLGNILSIKEPLKSNQ